jgi:predicted nuclease with TOPRIM domain
MTLDKIESKIRRIDEELSSSKAKAEELKNRIATLEKERETAENLRIVQIVRNTEITPEMLKTILSMQKSKSEPFIATSVLPEILPETTPVTAIQKEEKKERNYDNEESL